MEQRGNRIHFRKILYCKMIVVTLLLGVMLFFVLLWIYKASHSRFEEELACRSNTLTERIRQSVDIALKGLVEKTVSLTATNEQFGPLLSVVKGEDVGKEAPFQRLKIWNHLEEMLNMNDDTNWMAVIDRRNEIYPAHRDPRLRNTVSGSIELLSLHPGSKEDLPNRFGNVVWLTSSNGGGLVLMHLVLDTNTMQLYGPTATEVKNTSLKAISEHIDDSKVGNFALYDRNGTSIYSTGIRVTGGGQDKRGHESGRGRARDYLYTGYPINRGKPKIAHIIDMTEKNRRFPDLLHLISGIGFLVFLVILASLRLMFGDMAKSLRALPDNIHRVSEEDSDLKPTLFRKGDKMDVLVFNIQEMSGRIKALTDQVARDREARQQGQYQLSESQYHELRSQVNPHFLFNIFRLINGIAQINGDKQASRLVYTLSKFFRGNLERRNMSCQLRGELEYSKDYLELHKDTHPGRSNIKWDMDQRSLHVRAPTYILQPIVENSLVHSMESMIGTHTTRIRVKEENGYLVIRIWDDEEGIEPEKLMWVVAGRDESRHIGIRNVQGRIRMLYGDEYGLSIRSEYHEYIEVKLTLPLG